MEEDTHVFLRLIGNKTLTTLLGSCACYSLPEDSSFPPRQHQAGAEVAFYPNPDPLFLVSQALRHFTFMLKWEGTTALVQGIPTWFHISEDMCRMHAFPATDSYSDCAVPGDCTHSTGRAEFLPRVSTVRLICKIRLSATHCLLKAITTA